MKPQLLLAAAFALAVTVTTASGQEKWASNVRVVVFTGGESSWPFSANIYNGAKQAQADLGCKVDFVSSNWSPQTMIRQFQDAVLQKPDGICVMGHPGDEYFDSLIAGAAEKGIVVTSLNAPLPKAEAKYASVGFGYVGAEQYQAGHDLGVEAVKRFGLQGGDRAVVWGPLLASTRGLRTKGVMDALKEAKLTVDFLELDAATTVDPTNGLATFVSYVSSHPDVKLFVPDASSLTESAGTYLMAAGKKPGQIGVAGFDLSSNIITAINDGWVGLIIDQQEWLQGYLPVLQVCLAKVYGFSGLHINTGAGFVDKSNVGVVAQLVIRNIR